MSLNKKEISAFQGLITNADSDVSFKYEDWNVTQLLSMLPKHRVSANFDRKMAAAFSLELERELQQKNADLIRIKS